ncbi:hypothetical protein K7432_011648 [Basidiobolus ranarum]|uniref:Uncharacterized protein n=1 Tax=Basidiobolus ranarum TaxID=34480 RepID=A0ABR2VTI9_9FUNG
MSKHETCLCCINIRIGCLILTGFELLLGLLFLVLISLNWGGVTNSSFNANNNDIRSDSNASTFQAGRIGLYLLFAAFFVTFWSSIFGFMGIIRHKSWMLLTYLVLTVILMLAEFVGMVLAFINHEWYNGVLAIIAFLLQSTFVYNIARYREVVIAEEHAINYSGVYAAEEGNQEYTANPALQPATSETEVKE